MSGSINRHQSSYYQGGMSSYGSSHRRWPTLSGTLLATSAPTNISRIFVATLKEGSLLLLPWQQQLMSLVVEAAVKNVKNFPFPKEVIINEKFFREG